MPHPPHSLYRFTLLHSFMPLTPLFTETDPISLLKPFSFDLRTFFECAHKQSSYSIWQFLWSPWKVFVHPSKRCNKLSMCTPFPSSLLSLPSLILFWWIPVEHNYLLIGLWKWCIVVVMRLCSLVMFLTLIAEIVKMWISWIIWI